MFDIDKSHDFIDFIKKKEKPLRFIKTSIVSLREFYKNMKLSKYLLNADIFKLLPLDFEKYKNQYSINLPNKLLLNSSQIPLQMISRNNS